MPELPEVEIVRQSLEKKVRDKIIQKVLIKNRNLRFKIQSNFQKHLLKKKIKKIDRFSKYIIITFEDSSGFIIHLGMSGRLKMHYIKDSIIREKHDHAEIFLNNDKKIVFNDPRRFGILDFIKTSKINGYKYFSNQPIIKC